MLSITRILAMSAVDRAYETRLAIGRARRAQTLTARNAAIGDYWALRRLGASDVADAEIRQIARSPAPELLRQQSAEVARILEAVNAYVERNNAAPMRRQLAAV